MKNITALFILLVSMSLVTSAQKDINAWKNENNLDQQYLVFKKNLNFWNGSYFFKEPQVDQFFGAIKDTIAAYDRNIVAANKEILSLKNELDTATKLTEEAQQNLAESLKRVNSINVLGMYLNKSTYTFIMYGLTLGLAILAAVVFLMYKKSNKTTVATKKEFDDLKEEFESYKKSSMDRYTKINTELHNTRMKLRKI